MSPRNQDDLSHMLDSSLWSEPGDHIQLQLTNTEYNELLADDLPAHQQEVQLQETVDVRGQEQDTAPVNPTSPDQVLQHPSPESPTSPTQAPEPEVTKAPEFYNDTSDIRHPHLLTPEECRQRY